MRREFHVRFCEGGGVKLPSATRLVMAFEDARSGRRMLNVLGKRLGRYGLTLHGTKTRYVDFRPERLSSFRALSEVIGERGLF